jgi:uncharacterized membrane protein YkoI
VTEAQLTRRNNLRVWDLSVEMAGVEDWHLSIDASTGRVVREERD